MFLHVSSQLLAVLGIHAGRFHNYRFNMISLRRKCPLWELLVLTRPVTTGSEKSISLKHVSYFETSSNFNVLLLLLLLLLLLTSIELSLGGSSPYTSTDKTNKNKYT